MQSARGGPAQPRPGGRKVTQMGSTPDSVESQKPVRGNERGPVFEVTTRRRLDAHPEELTAVLKDIELLQDWCSSVFMRCDVIDRGDPDGLGLTLRLHVKGFMPHSLFIIVRIVDVVPHRSMRVAVTGDLVGDGDITLVPDADGCEFLLNWRMSFTRAWMRPLARVLHPLFIRNHMWAMDRTSRLIVAEVHRRRESTGQIVRTRATFPHNLAIYRSWQERRAAATRWRD